MRADPLAVIEAAYDLDAKPEEWLGRLNATIGPLIDGGLGVYGAFVDASDPAALQLSATQAYRGRPSMFRAAQGAPVGSDPRRVGLLYRSGAPFASARRVVGRDGWQDIAARLGVPNVGDCAAVCAIDTAGHGCVFMAPRRRAQRVDARAVHRWGRVTAHVIAMHRLRSAVAGLEAAAKASNPDGEAILSPVGDVVHAVGIARARSARDALREAARRREMARGRMRRQSPDEALELWRALVEGRWSIVDRFERDGRRFLIAHENEPHAAGPRALTRREKQVVALVALGRPHKLIAYELGLSTHAIGRFLATAMRKLGFSTRIELARTLRAAWMSAPAERGHGGRARK